MAQSYSMQEHGSTNSEADPGNRRRVLVTGAAGRIGAYFAEHNCDRYSLRLMARGDEDNLESLHAWGEVVCGKLGDLDALKRFCTGVDTIVHMAGNPAGSAVWQELLDANIIGTYHVFAAAKAMGVKRVIYASSIHAVSGYAPDVQVKANEPVNPGDLYGVSKCFGEALARYMAEQEGVSAISLRIGGFQPPQTVQEHDGIALLDDWVSQRDLNQLIQKCIDVKDVKYATLHGLSDNRFKRLDISSARELVGYRPQDDSARELPQFRDVPLGRMETASVRDPGANSGLRADVHLAAGPRTEGPRGACEPALEAGKNERDRMETSSMADLIQDTGARQNSAEAPSDPQKNGSGASDAPGGGAAKAKSVGDLTAGQESYMGPRDAGESDKPGGASLGEAGNDGVTDRDPGENNAATPIGGDVDPGSTASSDETGQAGVNDRPGKDKAHPWNG